MRLRRTATRDRGGYLLHMSAIVVTGMGARHAARRGFCHASWAALIAGRDAQAPLELFDTSGCRCHQAASACAAGHLDGLSAKANSAPLLAHLAPGHSRRARGAGPGRAARCGSRAGTLCAKDLPISVSTTSPAAWPSAKTLSGACLTGKRVASSSDQIARYLPQQQVLDLQQTLGFAGHSVIIANACASGANAIGHAADLISTRRWRSVYLPAVSRRSPSSSSSASTRLQATTHRPLPAVRPQPHRLDDRRGIRLPRARIGGACRTKRGATASVRAVRLRPHHRFLSPHATEARR